MKKAEAIRFLSQHQPMPDDRDIDADLIERYDEARDWFLHNPDAECIPLFLNSFGNGDGLGVYPLVSDVLCQFSPAQVVPALVSAVSSPVSSVRYWSAQIAALFPDEKLIDPLVRLLEDKDRDIRYTTITALEQIGGERVRKELAGAAERETDDQVRQLLENVLSQR